MLIEKLLSQLYKAQATVFKPVKIDDIRALRMQMAKNKMSALPTDYIHFLSLTDGLMLNGLKLYGVSEHDRGDKAYVYPSLMSVNEDCLKYARRKDFVILGEKDEDYIVYNPKDKNYQIVDRMDLFVILTLPRFFDVMYLFTSELIGTEELEKDK